MKKIITIAILTALVWGCSKKTTPTASADKDAGMTTFTAKCNKCHDLPKPKDYEEDRWPNILNSMAKKAKLSDEEKNNVLAYVLANAKKS